MTRETTVRIGPNKIQIVLPEGFYRFCPGPSNLATAI